MKPFVKLIISIAIPLAIGAVAGAFTASSVGGWYAGVNKPSFNPPNWVFGPVWTTLYVLMGIAFFLVWNAGETATAKKNAMIFYFIQLALNFSWSFIFFYAQEPGWALVDIIVLLLLIFLTISRFARISAAAAWLLLPYACWVSFATVLNYAIWKLN